MRRTGSGEEGETFYKDRQQRAVTEERDFVPLTLAELGRMSSLMLRYTKLKPKIRNAAAKEEQKRISSIIQSHPSNDRQIERPWIIFKTNKLLKDEVPSQLANHFKFPRPYLFETIANLQQSAEIKSSSAAGAVCSAYHDWETELTGHQQRDGRWLHHSGGLSQ